MKPLHLAFAVIAALFVVPDSARAQVKVMISGGFSGPYELLRPEFEKATGLKVETGSGASQGNGPETVGAQLARGVAADIVILSRNGLNDLIKEGRIAAGTDLDLARTPLGIAVKSGGARPDVSTVDAFKQAVTSAALVSMPGSTSGIWMQNDLFPRLGLAGKVKLKVTARGADAAAAVASGQATFAIMPVSEIIHAPGVEMAGKVPSEIQFIQTFSAGIAANSNVKADAQKLINHLSSARAAEVIGKFGMDAVPRR